MDRCVARRTRSRTEQYLNTLLKRSKGIVDDHVEDQTENERKNKKTRVSRYEDYRPKPKPGKRRRITAADSRGGNSGVKLGSRDSEGVIEFVDVSEESGFVSGNSLGLKSEVDVSKRVSDVVSSNGLDPDEVTAIETDSDNTERYDPDEVIVIDTNGDTVAEPDPDEIISVGSEEDTDNFEKNELDINMDTKVCQEDVDDGDDDDADSSDCWHESSSSSDEESFDTTDDFDSEEESARTRRGRQPENAKCWQAKEDKEKYDGYWSKRKRKDFDAFKLLANSVWEKGEVLADDILPSGMKSGKGEKTKSNMEERSPLKYIFRYEEPKPVEKSEFEEELDQLWAEMEFALKSIEIGSIASAETVDEEMDARAVNLLARCSQGRHGLVLDEEIGLRCCRCCFIAVEIRYLSPTMDKYHSDVMAKRARTSDEERSFLHGLDFEVSGSVSSLDLANRTEGTLWDCVPGVKNTLYRHQQEGFDFIWKNIAGTTKLNELNSSNSAETGGCILSHSPGTGKTRLALVFLQAYLELFPNCHPVIIAPAGLLLTWEEEFRKWNVDVPFYNLNSSEFSGRESRSAVAIFEANRHRKRKNTIRMVKLFSWSKKKSVLGVSYHLYEKLAAEKSVSFVGKNKNVNVNADEERQEMRKILLEMPGLLVLDEGHTPRNNRSCIWKVLSRVQTRKRIILSGTPFQNNFLELSNILCLTRPAYADVISSRFKKFSKWRMGSKRGLREEQARIEELKALIAPFVHVHKGSILQQSLPGLRDSVVVMNLPVLQKKVLESIERSQSTFKLEHKCSAVSVHPSVLSCRDFTQKEKSDLGKALLEKLEKIKLDPSEGVKTRFLMEFIRLCEVINEKVLVFSQYIDILSLILEQLKSLFGWSEGKEVLYMDGKLEAKHRQYLINCFNDPNSKAKVFLASTRACSEGINLVGASRVVLLDVVWNPSVERQAISRAYRLGQKRVVYTYHLVVKGTPECDKYCKQAEKDRLSELVFSSATEKDNQKRSREVSEDRILDEMVWHNKLKDMFSKIIYQPKESNLIETFGSVCCD